MRKKRREWDAINRTVAALNTLFDKALDLATVRRIEWEAAPDMVRDIWERIRRSPLFTLDDTGALLDPQLGEEALDTLLGEDSAPVGYADPAAALGAGTLVPRHAFRAEHVSLPAAPIVGTLFTELLPPEDRERYASPAQESVAGPRVKGAVLQHPVVARAKSLVQGKREVTRGRAPVYLGMTLDEYHKLVARLFDLNMLTARDRVEEVNGLFGTYKEAGGDGTPPVLRLIFDGRRANAHFTDSPPVHLPHPCRLAELQLGVGEVLVGGKLDLKDYYHHLRVPDWLVPYLGLPAVRVGDLPAGSRMAVSLAAQGMAADMRVHPALTTLPMGWSHSVYIAQQVHTHLLHSRGALPAEQEITPDRGLNAARDCHSVYVDDLGVFAVGDRGDDAVPLRVDARLEAAVGVMEAVGIPENKKKREAGGTNLVSLGVCVDGDRGLLHACRVKLAVLVAATRHAIRRGWLTPKGLEKLVGRWTWLMILRRPTLSVFSRVYQYMRSGSTKRGQLWPSVARELQLAVDLAPFLFTDLRAGSSDLVVAVDASTEGMGVVYKRGTSREVLSSFMRGSLPPGDDTLPPPVGRPPHLHRTDERWFSRDWRIAVRGEWRYPLAHISDGEGQAALHALVWLGSRKWGRDKRHFLFQDSSAALSGMLKGRSSSPPMLRSLRKSAAVMLACGMWVSPSWVPSADNPADGPSRGVGVWGTAN